MPLVQNPNEEEQILIEKLLWWEIELAAAEAKFMARKNLSLYATIFPKEICARARGLCEWQCVCVCISQYPPSSLVRLFGLCVNYFVDELTKQNNTQTHTNQCQPEIFLEFSFGFGVFHQDTFPIPPNALCYCKWRAISHIFSGICPFWHLGVHECVFARAFSSLFFLHWFAFRAVSSLFDFIWCTIAAFEIVQCLVQLVVPHFSLWRGWSGFSLKFQPTHTMFGIFFLHFTRK